MSGVTVKYGDAPSVWSSQKLMPASVHCARQLCHALSGAMVWLTCSPPLRLAWTVVPGAQLPLPYHSMMSTSPPWAGSLLARYQAGQHPGVRQLNLTRASQVVLMGPRYLPKSLPL